MKYKELIYKITSKQMGPADEKKVLKKLSADNKEMNPAKKSLQIKDVLVGVMVGEETVLNKGISDALRKEVERTLTVLFNSPISDSFAFLPYDKITLDSMLELFPDRNHHFIATRENYSEIKEIKKTKLNLKSIFASMDLNNDFVSKIDYLVTVNIDAVEPTMKAALSKRNVMIFPLTFRGTENFAQPEKLVTPDPNGWVYNSSSGIWTKSWGWDGYQELPSWEAPDDWNLDPKAVPPKTEG